MNVTYEAFKIASSPAAANTYLLAALWLAAHMWGFAPKWPRLELPEWPHREASDPTVLYRFYAADGALLYVGITRTWDRRMRHHALKPWWPDVATTTKKIYRTRLAAARAEHAAITRENPRLNVARLSLEAHLRSARIR
jgi:hypothetical protein